MAGKKRKASWTKAQLDTLHECWKASQTRQKYLELVAQRMPEIPPPTALLLARKLSRSDRDWQMTARRKERECEERQLAKERNRQDRLRRHDERQRAKEWKGQREAIREALSKKHAEQVEEVVGSEFFFCPDTRQHVCHLSCVFRVFSKDDKYGFVHGGPCDKCERMDEHIPALERIIGGLGDEGQKS